MQSKLRLKKHKKGGGFVLGKALFIIALFIFFYLAGMNTGIEKGQRVARLEAKNNFQEVVDWMATCDLQLNDSRHTIVEVDCMTPEAYETANRVFGMGWFPATGTRI